MPQHKEQAQLELRELFQEWGRGKGTRGTVYGRAFQLMDQRLVTLKDITREGARIGISPGVIRMRRQAMLKGTSRAEAAVKRRKKKKKKTTPRSSPPGRRVTRRSARAMTPGMWDAFFNHHMMHVHPMTTEQHRAWKRFTALDVVVTGPNSWEPAPPSRPDARTIADWISTYGGYKQGSAAVRGALRWFKANS